MQSPSCLESEPFCHNLFVLFHFHLWDFFGLTMQCDIQRSSNIWKNTFIWKDLNLYLLCVCFLVDWKYSVNPDTFRCRSMFASSKNLKYFSRKLWVVKKVKVSNNIVKGLEKEREVLDEITTIKIPEMDLDVSVIWLGNLATRIMIIIKKSLKWSTKLKQKDCPSSN